MGHSHHHSHDHIFHDHDSRPGSTKRLLLAFLLNFAFTIIEIVGGILTNSMAILSDALHDMGDTLLLGLSVYLNKLSQKKRDQRFSFGYGRFSLLAALLNGIVLTAGSILVFWESVPRLFHPQHPDADGMLILAGLGLLVNGAAAFGLRGGKSHNEKMVTWHLLEDVFGWFAVLVAAIVLKFWNIPIIDPILSIGITCWILFNVSRNLLETLKIFLQAIPKGFDVVRIEKEISELPGVDSLHDTHIWSLDGAYNIVSTHVVLTNQSTIEDCQRIKKEAKRLMKNQEIQHVTIEVEFGPEKCDLKNC